MLFTNGGKYLLLLTLFFVPLSAIAVNSWPGDSGTVIATLSEPSGAVWNEQRNSLFIVEDNGYIRELSATGTILNTWFIGGDLEGATLADSNQYLYVGIENPDSIVEFDLQSGTLTGKTWDLTTWMTGPTNSGLEALSYANDYFYAGLQADGKIYVFNVNLQTSGQVNLVTTITPSTDYPTDISGLDYQAVTGQFYAVYDSYDRVLELDAQGVLTQQYTLLGDNQEGIALQTNCSTNSATVFIAEDDGEVVKYLNYPITCLTANTDSDTDTTNTNSTTDTTAEEDDTVADNATTDTTTSDIETTPATYFQGTHLYINGNAYKLFNHEPRRVVYHSKDFFHDTITETVVVGLLNKSARISVTQTDSTNRTTITQTKVLHFKEHLKKIRLSLKKRKFIAKFSTGTKVTTKKVWRISAAGKFTLKP